MKMDLQKNIGEHTVDDFLIAMEQFDKVHIEPVQKVLIVPPASYEEMKKIFDGAGVKVVKNQSIDSKVVGYLMDCESAEKCLKGEINERNAIPR